MAEELKQKFSEMQAKKHPKETAKLEVDEFEWIKLNQELSATRGTERKQQEHAAKKIQRESFYSHRLCSNNRLPCKWTVQVWKKRHGRVTNNDEGQNSSPGIHSICSTCWCDDTD